MKMVSKKWLFRWVFLIVISLVWVLFRLSGIGFSRVLDLWPGFVITLSMWIVGWQFGWLLGDLDKFIGKFFKGNVAITEFMLQWQTGIKNILAVGVLVILGVWMITSNGSFIAWGVVMGIQVRLWYEILLTTDYKKWYLQISREFSMQEHNLVKVVFLIAILFQILLIVRR